MKTKKALKKCKDRKSKKDKVLARRRCERMQRTKSARGAQSDPKKYYGT
jgi:hypothetical protein